jgi:hypothetical protein
MVKHITLKKAEHTVTAANGTPVKILGEQLIRFKLNDMSSSANMLVSDEVQQPMLGSDYLNREHCVWGWSMSILHVNGIPIKLHSCKATANCRRVMVDECIVLPPNSVSNVSLKMPHRTLRDTDSTWMIDTVQLQPGVHLARTVVSSDTCNVVARVCNVNHEQKILKQSATVGKAVPIEMLYSPKQTTNLE